MRRRFPFSAIPLLLITITISSHPPQSVSAQVDNYHRICSEPFDCGNITGIRYPFWVSTRPDYCGHPEFKLNCASGTAEITIQSLTYKVLEINNQSHNLKVARKDYIDNICPRVPATTSLNFNFYDYDRDLQNITLYYSCPLLNPSIPTGPETFTFDCDSSSGFFVTRNLDTITPALLEYLRTCKDKVIVPATQSAVKSLETGGLTVDKLIVTLQQGFGLEWHANDSLCTRCESSGGICGSNSSDGSFACYCIDRPYPESCGGAGLKQSESSGSKSRPVTVEVGGSSNRVLTRIGIAAAAIVGICLTCFCCFVVKRRFWIGNVLKLRENRKVEEFIVKYQSLMPQRYSYIEIRKMTNSFVDKLGKGGFGDVYKGKLSDGRIVAVKVLNKSTSDNGEEFINEVESIGRTSHVNIVALLGFCYDRNLRALIYEFMPNGSLDKFIYDSSSEYDRHRLDWKTLYDIAVGAAKGLEYLHCGCNTRIVHFDIKPHNILLNEDFCPKISDFGLAKLYKGKESLMSMLSARGTIGYIAPEVYVRNFRGVSYKSDVYSYGMMILEMFGGRKKIHDGVTPTSDMYFPDSIYKYIESSRTTHLLHEHKTNNEDDIVRRAMIVGLWCIQINPSDRPSMTTVVQMLEGRVESLQVPPRPSLYPTTTHDGSAVVSSTAYICSEREEV